MSRQLEGSHSPKVVRRVSVSDQDDGHGGVVLDGEDPVGRAGIVFFRMSGERFEERFPAGISWRQTDPRRLRTLSRHSGILEDMIALRMLSAINQVNINPFP